MSEMKTIRINGVLSGRILRRLGKTEGVVEVREEQWDFGLCETCSQPEEGFSVYVDGEQVWPNEESLAAQGGYIYGDENGWIEGKRLVLSEWGLFDV